MKYIWVLIRTYSELIYVVCKRNKLGWSSTGTVIRNNTNDLQSRFYIYINSLWQSLHKILKILTMCEYLWKIIRSVWSKQKRKKKNDWLMLIAYQTVWGYFMPWFFKFTFIISLYLHICIVSESFFFLVWAYMI